MAEALGDGDVPEADEQDGWWVQRNGGYEVWQKELADGTALFVYCLPDGEVSWAVKDWVGRQLRERIAGKVASVEEGKVTCQRSADGTSPH